MTKRPDIEAYTKALLESVSRREILRFATIATCSISTGALAQAKTSPRRTISPAGARRTQTMREQPNIALRNLTPNSALVAAPAPTQAQKDVAAYVADRVRHEMASAVASPLNTNYPANSIATATQQYMRTRGRAAQTAARANAVAVFNRSAAQQQPVFGRYAGRGAVADRSSVAADATLNAKLRAAIDESMQASQASVAGDAMTIGSASPSIQQMTGPTKTTAEIRMDWGDHGVEYRTDLSVNTPQTLTIRWSTTEPGATHATWTVTKIGAGRKTQTISGPAGSAPGGQFTVNLANILPPAPPDTPINYQIKVQSMKQNVSYGTQNVSKGKGSTPVGKPSRPIVVTYRKPPAITRFEIEENLGHYQRIEFYVNKVTCIEETDEASGSDEILLGGFFTLSNGAVGEIGTWTVSEDFDKGESHPAPGNRPVPLASFKMFHKDFVKGNFLNNELVDDSPSRIPFPRAYSFGLVMGERDNGGFGEIINGIMVYILDELEKLAKKHATSFIGAAGGAALGSIVPGFGTVIGLVIGAIIGELIDEIFEWFKEFFHDADNLLQQRVFNLELASSRAEEIHKLPGSVVQLSNGKTEFVANKQKMRFAGLGGKYDVEVFWKATARVFDY